MFSVSVLTQFFFFKIFLTDKWFSFQFYQETLKDDTEAEKEEDSEEKKEDEDKQEKENAENGDVEMKDVSQDEDDNMDIDESEDTGSIQIGLGGDTFGGGGINSGEQGML